MNFIIRRARREDAAAISRVHLASWKTTYRGIIPDAYIDSLNEQTSTRNWQQLFEASTVHIFAAETQSPESEPELFGFIAGGPIREPVAGYDVELHAIYLLKGGQQQGAGRALVRALATTLRDEGGKSMMVWALAANPAVEFYKRLGAIAVLERSIEIGGAELPDLALGWPTLDALV